jgi:hypothetical protein
MESAGNTNDKGFLQKAVIAALKQEVGELGSHISKIKL